MHTDVVNYFFQNIHSDLPRPVHISALVTNSGESFRVFPRAALRPSDPDQRHAGEGEGGGEGELAEEADAV